MTLSREALKKTMTDWLQAWNTHDIDGVMALFHNDVFFEHWHGASVSGKENLRAAWTPWFKDHGNFKFTTEDLIIDESAQKVLYQWEFNWPSFERGFEGKPEKRRGVDVIHFEDGKIIKKETYSKTTIEIDGQKVRCYAIGG
jgi:ketosteroid isomerase-like protein